MGGNKQIPSFVAIRPHVKLFNIVRREYQETSTINQEGAFSRYYLNNRWDYVNMARDCVNNRKLLIDCKITPIRKGSVVDNGPFWFKIVQTRPDGSKLSPEEICDLFWRKLNKEGFSLYILGMTFQEITENINFCITEDAEHSISAKVTMGDVVLSCKKINKNKNRSWYGYKCLLTLDTGKFKKSIKNTKGPKDTMIKKTPIQKNTVETLTKSGTITTIKPPVIKTMAFTQKSLPTTANFQ